MLSNVSDLYFLFQLNASRFWWIQMIGLQYPHLIMFLSCYGHSVSCYLMYSMSEFYWDALGGWIWRYTSAVHFVCSNDKYLSCDSWQLKAANWWSAILVCVMVGCQMFGRKTTWATEVWATWVECFGRHSFEFGWQTIYMTGFGMHIHCGPKNWTLLFFNNCQK